MSSSSASVSCAFNLLFSFSMSSIFFTTLNYLREYQKYFPSAPQKYFKLPQLSQFFYKENYASRVMAEKTIHHFYIECNKLKSTSSTQKSPSPNTIPKGSLRGIPSLEHPHNMIVISYCFLKILNKCI